MNIGFYDPISQRWIKPRPEKEPAPVPCVSLGEALLNATEAAALKERNDRIWKITRQVAEGVNAPTAEAPLVVVEPTPITIIPEEYEIVESLGFIYWKPKDGQCSGQQE